MQNETDIWFSLKCPAISLAEYCKNKEDYVALREGDILVCKQEAKEVSYWVFSQVEAGVHKFIGLEGNRLSDNPFKGYDRANCRVLAKTLLSYFSNCFPYSNWYVLNMPKYIFRNYHHD